jgi:transcriptional regulator with XRE-family HTH domain
MSIEKDKKNSLGSRIRDERERLGFSQKDFGQLIGLSREMVGKHERDVCAPGGDVLVMYCRIGMDIRYVLTGEVADDSPRYPITPRISELTTDQIDTINQMIDELAKSNEKDKRIQQMVDVIKNHSR